MISQTWPFSPQLLFVAAQWLLAAIFLAAAVSKLRHPRRFVAAMLAYQVLPKKVALPFARLLPWGELLVGLLLLVGVATRAAALASALLLLAFMAAMALNLRRGRKPDCGCHGKGRPISKQLLLRNTLLLLLALLVARFDDGTLSLAGSWQRAEQPWLDIGLPLALDVLGVWCAMRLLAQLRRFNIERSAT